MTENRITEKQKQILEFIRDCILKKGYPPAVREICEAVNLKSTSSVHSHLETLERNGYIRRDPTKPRAIEIVDDEFGIYHGDIVRVPIVGQVAAGEPILATENIEDFYPFPADQLPKNEMFMLRVKGDSMINMGIFNQDLVLVEKQSTANNGEVIVALIEDSATVKRFYRENDHIRLQPENDSMDPILVPSCEILGKVIGLIRTKIQ
ncbi:MAG: transcriptional repressor LexA [Clostridiales bacterium]|nr:transcriptional repressor LexA [Clostridiales bacterium]